MTESSAVDSPVSPVSSGLRQNHDEALDPNHQHLHRHVFHSSSAHKSPEIHADVDITPREDPPAHPVHETSLRPQLNDSYGAEKGLGVSAATNSDPDGSMTETVVKQSLIRKYRLWVYIFIGALFTAWFISILAQDKTRHSWLIPFLLWLFIMIRLITFYVPTRPLLTVANYIWQRTIVKAVSFIPEKFRLPLGGLGCIGVILIGTFCTKEYPNSKHADRAVSFFGCVVAIAGLFATSRNRKKIQWHTVITGMLIQYIVALFVLRTKAGYDIFNFISFLARELLGFAGNGVAFLTDTEVAAIGFFLITTLPAIVFFIAFVSIFYYWGLIQWFVEKFAHIFFWSMRVSGAEAVVAAASPFIGQGESAVLIRPFIAHLTDAEIHQVMCSGFATIAGSVLVAYIGMGVNPQALVSSCVMSIPASLAVSKLRFPEEEETLTSGRVVVPDDESQEADNVLHAFSNGAWLGLIIAATIMANVMCIIALVALINALLGWFFRFWGVPALTLEQIFGYVFYPVAFLLGAPRDELYPVAKLIGVKVIQNEFVAYTLLASDEYSGLSTRSRMLATYALCGFANLGSVATQIGVLGQLAPTRKATISKLAISALITGCISTLISAAVAGMTLADMTAFETTTSS